MPEDVSKVGADTRLEQLAYIDEKFVPPEVSISGEEVIDEHP